MRFWPARKGYGCSSNHLLLLLKSMRFDQQAAIWGSSVLGLSDLSLHLRDIIASDASYVMPAKNSNVFDVTVEKNPEIILNI